MITEDNTTLQCHTTKILASMYLICNVFRVLLAQNSGCQSMARESLDDA